MFLQNGFDTERAFEHIRALNFPRRVGTRGERRAARYIAKHFESIGLSTIRERFTVSHFPAEIGSRLVLLATLGCLIFGFAVLYARPWLAAASWFSAVLLNNAPWRVGGLVGRRWPPRTRTENLVAVQSARESLAVRVIFMAHYDTKSQLLPTGIRVGFVFAATGVCVLLTLLAVTLASGALTRLAIVWPAIFTGIGAVTVVGLLVNVTGNTSSGAIDNGSGLGALLELATQWQADPVAEMEVVWVASGSEEVWLDGARHFLELHKNWWRERPTLLINLESVGSGSLVRLAGEPAALSLACAVADDLRIPHGGLHILGAGSDHEPFASCGLSALSIMGDVIPISYVFHSRLDRLERVEREALERGGRLADQLARRWAMSHARVSSSRVAARV